MEVHVSQGGVTVENCPEKSKEAPSRTPASECVTQDNFIMDVN